MTNSKNNLNQMNIWKENLLNAKAEKEAKEKAKEERIKYMMESGEMYDNMVSDTVGLITTKITDDTKSAYRFHDEKDGVVTITIYKALVITADLRLYSGCYSVPTNPNTGKQYFFESYRFKGEEEVKKYFEDVRAQLPQDIKFKEHMSEPTDVVARGARIYDVQVEIDLNN